jgi:hypothetical protein
MFNEDEENRPEKCGRHRMRCFVLFSLCSAVTGQLLGRGKQLLKRALNAGPESICRDGILARDSRSQLSDQ